MTDFCRHCGRQTKYEFKKTDYDAIIDGENYTFKISQAICEECGSKMKPHGIVKKNIGEIRKGYKEQSC